MHERFERRIEEGLASLQKMAQKRTMTAVQLSHRVGRLMGQKTRAAGGIKPSVTARAEGRAAPAGARSGHGHGHEALLVPASGAYAGSRDPGVGHGCRVRGCGRSGHCGGASLAGALLR